MQRDFLLGVLGEKLRYIIMHKIRIIHSSFFFHALRAESGHFPPHVRIYNSIENLNVSTRIKNSIIFFTY